MPFITALKTSGHARAVEEFKGFGMISLLRAFIPKNSFRFPKQITQNLFIILNRKNP